MKNKPASLLVLFGKALNEISQSLSGRQVDSNFQASSCASVAITITIFMFFCSETPTHKPSFRQKLSKWEKAAAKRLFTDRFVIPFPNNLFSFKQLSFI